MAELVVAFDFPTAAVAREFAGKIAGAPVWYKIGLELFTAAGPELVRGFAAQGVPVFLDLKFHDIPHTVQGATASATRLGVRMLTLHQSGGAAMAEAALVGRRMALESCRAENGEQPVAPLLLGVTVLTSDGGMEPAAVQALVVERACAAKASGLDGVVCSGLEAAAVKAACGQGFFCLCPGIRFAGGAGGDDQARVCTPEEAVAFGADFLVMGRPITGAAEPLAAIQAALCGMGIPCGV